MKPWAVGSIPAQKKKKKKKEAGHLLCKQSPLNIRKLEREMKTGLAA
jgi:hypothetical protein